MALPTSQGEQDLEFDRPKGDVFLRISWVGHALDSVERLQMGPRLGKRIGFGSHLLDTICVTHLVPMRSETKNRTGEFQSRPQERANTSFSTLFDAPLTLLFDIYPG